MTIYHAVGLLIAIVMVVLLCYNRKYPKCPACNPWLFVTVRHKLRHWFDGRMTRVHFFGDREELRICQEHGPMTYGGLGMTCYKGLRFKNPKYS